jgi:lipopolysaccharide export system permease protein
MLKKLKYFLILQNSLISRYINQKLLSIFLAIFFIIGLIVFGNQFVLTVNESFTRGIPFRELLPIVSLNMIRDIPLIVSLSLFLAIIITITQLYKNSEAVVMNSVGLSILDFFLIIQPVIIIFFLSLLSLTTYFIPAAKYQKNIIENQNENSSEFSFITEGKFEEFKQGEIVFFTSNSNSIDDSQDQNMEEIFIYAFNNNEPVIVVASQAQKYTNLENNGTYLRLKNGIRYQGAQNLEINKILNFDSYDLEIVSGEAKNSINISKSIESEKTIDLLSIGSSFAISEFQWRFSQPISVLVLSLIGVLLGKTSPRSTKRINLLVGVVIFIIYNNFLLIIKSSIEGNFLNPLIGFFGIHMSIILIFSMLYMLSDINYYKFVDKIPFLILKSKKHV